MRLFGWFLAAVATIITLTSGWGALQLVLETNGDIFGTDEATTRATMLLAGTLVAAAMFAVSDGLRRRARRRIEEREERRDARGRRGRRSRRRGRR